MRVFTDTNFLISAFLSNGFSSDLLNTLIKNHHIVYNQAVKNELRDKFENKFHLPREIKDGFLQKLTFFEKVADSYQEKIKLRDSKDDVVLGSAIASKVDVLLTGDKDLLSVSKQVSELEILSPRQFWEKYHES